MKKKLTLKKTTVASLTNAQMNAAAGGEWPQYPTNKTMICPSQGWTLCNCSITSFTQCPTDY